MGLAWPFGCMQHTTLGVRGLEGSPWGRRGLDGISCAFFPNRQNSSRERRRRLGKGGLHGLMDEEERCPRPFASTVHACPHTQQRDVHPESGQPMQRGAAGESWGSSVGSTWSCSGVGASKR